MGDNIFKPLLRRSPVATDSVLSRLRRFILALLPRQMRHRLLETRRRGLGRSTPNDSLMHFRATEDALRRGRMWLARRQLDTAISFILPRDSKAASVLRAEVWKSLAVSHSRLSWADSSSLQSEVRRLTVGFTSSQLAPLSQGLAAIGLFQYARIFRQMSLQRSISEFEKPGAKPQLARRAFFAHLEQDNILAALDIAERVRFHEGLLPQEMSLALTALGLARESTTRGWRPPTDDQFSALVEGRRVVIVGAAPTDEENLVARGCYDCVVRMTPTPALRGESHSPERRCDIAYVTTLSPAAYRSLNSRFRTTGLKLQATATPQLIVMKRAGKMTYLAGIPIRGVANLRIAAIGSPTGGTQAVVDILRFNPRSLDLCGFNFYTSSQIYSPEVQAAKKSSPRISGAGRDFYWTKNRLHPSIHSIQWAAHDLASDFMFLKTLIHHNEKVRAIGRAAEVLDWSLERYYQRFDELRRGLN